MTREDVIDKLKEFVEDALYYNYDCDYVGCMPIELVQSAIEFLQERSTEKEEEIKTAYERGYKNGRSDEAGRIGEANEI